MKLKSAIIALGAVAFALGSAALGGAGEKPRAFQLVYHSDTRGYYRPCG